MKLRTFALERYFAAYEFTAQYLLSCSDSEAFSLKNCSKWPTPTRYGCGKT